MKNRCYQVVVFNTSLNATSKHHDYTVVATDAKKAIDKAIRAAKRTYPFTRGWVVESLQNVGVVS